MSNVGIVNQAYVMAADLYRGRRDKRYYPQGRKDGGGRWYPAETEDCGITGTIRSPSRAWPWSYYKACFSYEHCALVVGIREPNIPALRSLVRRIDNLN